MVFYFCHSGLVSESILYFSFSSAHAALGVAVTFLLGKVTKAARQSSGLFIG